MAKSKKHKKVKVVLFDRDYDYQHLDPDFFNTHFRLKNSKDFDPDRAGKFLSQQLESYLNGEIGKESAMDNQANYPLSDNWTKPVDNVISMPDHLDPLFHKLGMQLRFHTISGKSELTTLISMVRIAEQFFLDPAKKKDEKEVQTNV